VKGAALLVVVAGALGACGGFSIEGADAVPPSEVPTGETLAEFFPYGCVDRHAHPVPRPDTRLTLLSRGDRRLLLLEARPLHDTLVVHNAFSTPGHLTFQAISNPSEGARALSEYRFEWPRARRGQLSTSLSFDAEPLASGAFRATSTEVALICQLRRERSEPELDTRGAVR
jgi:hypothetical protein